MGCGRWSGGLPTISLFASMGLMDFRFLRHAIPLAVAAGLITGPGCATSLVRSGGASEPEHPFPAATADVQFFWESGVKGDPILQMVDPNYRSDPRVRLMCCIGALVDFPFSIAFDVVLLPLDLSRMASQQKNRSPEEQQTE